MFNVIDQYNSFVENNFIKKNVDQIKFLKQANNVWSSYSKTKLFFKDKIFEGIYLYGQVGTGKTFLLNLFYQNSKIGKKIHFNNLMNEIHDQVKNSNNKELAIENYVKNLSKDSSKKLEPSPMAIIYKASTLNVVPIIVCGRANFQKL